jgi:transcriptional regulator with XRE-family HTH domain
MQRPEETLAKNIKEIIDFLGLTQEEAAERCGITTATMSLIINGQRNPSFKSIVKILKAFNIKFERLIKE